MKTDIYTKAILTVIAMSLFGICIQMTMKDAYAQQGFRFTQSGAMVVAVEGLRISNTGILPVNVCDRNLRGGQTWCADVEDFQRK
jgi:hypothetical protein